MKATGIVRRVEDIAHCVYGTLKGCSKRHQTTKTADILL